MVTGGGRGIGAAVCERLASDGNAVVVNYSRSEVAARTVVSRIIDAGGQAAAVGADIADTEQAQHLINAACQLFGPPTVLVNNAGMNSTSSLRAQPPEQWDRVIGVNLSGAFYCTHAALAHMYEAGWGRIVFFGSPSAGRRTSPGTGAYAAAKAGLIGMTKTLAQEVFRRGITVNTVVPGFVATDIVASASNDAIAALRNSWPEVPPETVASTVSFLVSEGASHVSGEEIGVWAGGPVSL
ncbi:3-oxoacyl-ACP reductase [Rhodococcus sp. 14-2686-1-2]|nr:3-oxoacyl-ACP reductase [Rhodococcus sp. 15-1189-1-1a]OZF07724.1 3-oxoacyl-ACP reductase [Rhodococcus sp. 14-2686-1-2]